MGDCFDEGMNESFSTELEFELVEHRSFRTQVEAPAENFTLAEG